MSVGRARRRARRSGEGSLRRLLAIGFAAKESSTVDEPHDHRTGCRTRPSSFSAGSGCVIRSSSTSVSLGAAAWRFAIGIERAARACRLRVCDERSPDRGLFRRDHVDDVGAAGVQCGAFSSGWLAWRIVTGATVGSPLALKQKLPRIPLCTQVASRARVTDGRVASGVSDRVEHDLGGLCGVEGCEVDRRVVLGGGEVGEELPTGGSSGPVGT